MQTEISFLLFPLGPSDAVKLKWFYLCERHIISNAQTDLYSFCLEEQMAEDKLLRNDKLVVLFFKTMHYLGFH